MSARVEEIMRWVSHYNDCPFMADSDATCTCLRVNVRAAVEALVREAEQARGGVLAAWVALARCDELFSEIRNDWTDPRHACREGRSTIEVAQLAIAPLLPGVMS
jgi:hypothetical protein